MSSKVEDKVDNEFVCIDLITSNSELKEHIVAYIAGYIVRKMVHSLICIECCDALISSSNEKKCLSLVAIKDRGGLIYPSEDVIRVACLAERVFRQFVSGESPENMKITGTRKLHLKLVTKTVYEATISDIFSNLFHHDMQYATNLVEDLHSTQLIKEIASRYFTMRLARYGQEYMLK